MLPFNDTSSTKSGIIQDCEITLFGDEGYGSISGDTNRLLQFTNRANRALDRLVYLAMTADEKWQFDDSNYNDLAIATTDIVATQRDYQFALDHLEIEKVLIQRNDGVWVTLDPLSKTENKNTYYENNAGNTGVPTRYEKRGNTIFLDVVPDYSLVNALKIYFTRGASYFTSTDTTKTAGFASPFHKFIPLHMKTHYAIDRQMPLGKNLYDLLQVEENAIKDFYSNRMKDEKPRLQVTYQNNK
jgi:hypothetical protein